MKLRRKSLTTKHDICPLEIFNNNEAIRIMLIIYIQHVYSLTAGLVHFPDVFEVFILFWQGN